MPFKDQLEALGQKHLLNQLENLSREEQDTLFQQLKEVDFHLLKKQRELIDSYPTHNQPDPYIVTSNCGNQKDRKAGEEIIQARQAGCLLLAGGQGTRLGHSGPKGTFELEGKSLFERLAEKIARLDKSLPLAIMTSSENDTATRDYWKKHHFFGLKNVSFFTQGELPLLNEERELFLDAPNHLAMAPDGNGLALAHFVSSGLHESWSKQGIKTLNVIPVDNPLADPFDAELIGYHTRKKADATIKCVKRLNPQERVGVIVRQKEKIAIVEYSELEASDTRDYFANIGLFCLDMEFIEQTALKKLPLHRAHKRAKYWINGKLITPKNPNAWKFEYFIFDIISFAEHVEAIAYPRETCFAPLKNATGPDSPATVVEKLRMR